MPMVGSYLAGITNPIGKMILNILGRLGLKSQFGGLIESLLICEEADANEGGDE